VKIGINFCTGTKCGIGGVLVFSALLIWAFIDYPKLDNLAVTYTPYVLSDLTDVNFYDPAITYLAVFVLWALFNYAVIFGIFVGLGLIGTSLARRV
jgi:hypothetical protein